MRLVLEILSGSNRGRQINVETGETVRVGRARPAEVALGDDFMSGLHFALKCDARGCRVRDLNSRNGTKVNGELIIEAPLKDGDQLFAGRTHFSVRLEGAKSSTSKSFSRSRADSLSGRRSSRNISRRSLSGKSSASKSSESLSGAKRKAAAVKPAPEAPPSSPVKQAPPSPQASIATPPAPPRSVPAPPPEIVPAVALDSYEAATMEGRLFQILSSQPQPLMALIDAIRDPGILDLLQRHPDEHQSLYRSEQDPRIAPHLVRFAPRSALLKQMIQKGWGRQWGLYLTSALSLNDLRQYFRTALMVTMPDGAELFSRFYDPRFFRTFLESCTAAESESYFGPVTKYFMEDERAEILLEFTRGSTGAEKKGHLLSPLN
jgi:pSer/pThr/pTyr-binding forkhead associated (FHA) protein